MTNIFHIVGGFDISGRSKVVADIVRGLRNDFNFTVVSLSDNMAYCKDGIECAGLGKKDGFDIKTVFRLARRAKESGAAVFHSHGRGALVYSVLAAKLAGVRNVVHTVHRADGDLVACLGIMRGALLGRVDAVTAVSGAAAQTFAGANGCSDSKVTVIYNGIDAGLYRQRHAGGGPGENPVVGTVANFSRDKDHETLLKGFAGLQGSYPGARLIIVGDGPGLNDAKNLAAQLGIARSVDFMGFRDNVPAVLSGFDVFVYSTRTEGLGIAVLEAMAAGVPVVAAKVGGVLEIIEDGVSGLLCEAGNHEAMRDGILRILKDSALGDRFIFKAREKLARNFTLDKMCGAYREVYMNLIIKTAGKKA